MVKQVFTRFDRRKSVGYQIITPDTSLDVLDEFLKDHPFAIGTSIFSLGGLFICDSWLMIVTDESRKFVLGVATRSDLEEYAKRRVY